MVTEELERRIHELAAQLARARADRDRLEERLHTSEERFHALAEQLHFQVGLLDAVQQAVIATNCDGIILHWNRHAERLYGWPAQEVLGRNVLDVVPIRDTYEPARALSGRLRRGESWSGEFTIRRRDGSVLHVLVLDSPIHDHQGVVAGVVSVSIDITERKRAEESAHRLAQEQAARAAAEAAQRRFAFLAEAGGILACSLDYRATVAQLARLAVPYLADWCTVHLRQPDGSIQALTVAHVDPEKGAWAAELQQRYPPDPMSPHGIPRVLRTGQPIFWAEVPEGLLDESAQDPEHLRLLKKLAPRSSMVLPLQARGRILGALSVHLTSNKRRYGPDDLALASDLARRVALAIDNALLYTEVLHAAQRKDEFLALLSHELRNPLAPLRNALHILGRTPNVDAEVQPLYALMERQVRTLAHLVDDLLDVARITRGKVDLRAEPVELATLIARAVETTRPLVEERGHRLTVDIPGQPLLLWADPTRLEQVLTNLLNNAARYTMPAGQIWLEARRVGDQVRVCVRDTGIGIRAEMLPRIFDAFQQADRPPGCVAEGLGIGLSLVRNLVELHGGTVSARSAGPGQGSEFEVCLPLAGSVNEEREPSRPERVAGSPLRILVVDDNEDTTRTLAMLLELDGHEVRTAFDGPGALQEATAFRPDVALLDIGLPGEMDGHALARRLRVLPETASTQLIAMTGWGQDPDRQRSHEAGFALHVVKPIDPAELRDVLARFGASANRAAELTED